MTEITATSQLSTFTVLRDILLNNSTLAKKFTKRNIYQFEPLIESVSFDMLPYITINVPVTSTDSLTIDQYTNIKEFSIMITLVMGYEAKDNYVNYANAIIRQIETSMATLEQSGYYNVKINITNTDVEMIGDKKVIVGQFMLECSGSMERD